MGLIISHILQWFIPVNVKGPERFLTECKHHSAKAHKRHGPQPQAGSTVSSGSHSPMKGATRWAALQGITVNKGILHCISTFKSTEAEHIEQNSSTEEGKLQTDPESVVRWRTDFGCRIITERHRHKSLKLGLLVFTATRVPIKALGSCAFKMIFPCGRTTLNNLMQTWHRGFNGHQQGFICWILNVLRTICIKKASNSVIIIIPLSQRASPGGFSLIQGSGGFPIERTTD